MILPHLLLTPTPTRSNVLSMPADWTRKYQLRSGFLAYIMNVGYDFLSDSRGSCRYTDAIESKIK